MDSPKPTKRLKRPRKTAVLVFEQPLPKDISPRCAACGQCINTNESHLCVNEECPSNMN
jgi:hypothetical protein